jgi:integrase
MTARRPSSLPPPRFGWSARTPLTGVSPTPGGSFSIRHTEAVTQRVHEARRVLDLSINYYEQFKRFGDRLASERCTEHQLRAVLDKLYPNGTSDSVSSRTRSSRQQTGLRVSELTGLRNRDVTLGTAANCRVTGKGRKERCAMLTTETMIVLRAWCDERQGQPKDPLFPTRQGGPLTPKAVAWFLDKHVTSAARACPSLASKRVTPHVLRHTNAMLLRAENVDLLTIALWLGHESTASTEIYMHADNKHKQEALDRIAPTGTPPGRYQPPDRLLAFLDRLSYPQRHLG